jgi:hypothetical protein
MKQLRRRTTTMTDLAIEHGVAEVVLDDRFQKIDPV